VNLALKFFLCTVVLSAASANAFSQDLDKKIDSLNRVLKTEKEDTNKINTLNALAFELQQASNFSNSLANANSAMALAKTLSFQKGVGDAYNNLGVVYWNQGNYTEGLKSLSAALKIGQDINNDMIIAKSYTATGNIYLKQSNIPEAMKYFGMELGLREKMGDKYELGFSYRRMANAYVVQGNYPEAIKNYLASLKIDEETHNQLGICYTYCNMGVVYGQQGNYAEALKNYFASLAIAKAINRIQPVADDYYNISSVYGAQGNYSEAIKYGQDALKIEEQIGNKHSIAWDHNDIGLNYFRLGNYSEALKNERAALGIATEIGDKANIASASDNLGDIYIILKQYDKARQYMENALSVSKETESKELIKDSYGHLAQLDSVTGNFEGAYQNLQLYTTMKDSLINEESNKQISQLKIQYDTEKKDQQIETQALQNRILSSRIYYSVAIALLFIGMVVLLFIWRNRRKKKEYEHALVSLELTLLKSQLNPHFISNSLSAIKAFIDKQPERASQFLSKFARLIRLVLEQSEQPLITLEEELKTVELYMQIESLRLDQGFDYRFELDDSVDKTELMVPPLILQPTIENAIWHGLAPKSDKGHIIIRIKLENELLKFRIEDNGNGQKPEPQSENVNPRERKSFGVAITRKRIELLSKELKREGYFNLNFLDGCTVAEIALPVNLH